MNLGQFHDRVRNAIKRGTSQDALIPDWTAEAANLLELNYSFSWMNYTSTVAVLAANNPANRIAAPANLKSMEWIKPIINQNGQYVWYGEPLQGVTSNKVLGITGGNPAGWWMDGLDYIMLDSLPGVDRSYVLNYNQLTDWPTDETQTPNLLARGFSVLLAQTLILGAMDMKDGRMQQLYEARLETSIGMLLRADEELKLHPQNDLKMRYSGLD